MKGRSAVEPHKRYILEHMHGVTVAADSLTAYCARHPDSSVAQVPATYLKEGFLFIKNLDKVPLGRRDF